MYKKRILRELMDKRIDLINYINEINQRLLYYRKGSLFRKNNYFYIKYYEEGKVISKYIGKDLTTEQIDNINRELKNHKTLQKKKIDYLRELKEIEKLIRKYGRNV